jgi:DNA-directed RNA polymerase specialized sigma subunit
MAQEDELILWKRYKETGDEQALTILLNTYRPLLKRRIRQQYSAANIPQSAIEIKGLTLTINALDTYDPTRGRSISSHVFEYWKKLHRFVDQQKQVARISESRSGKVAPYMQAVRQLQEDRGRPASTQELADHLGWEERDINKLKREITFEDPMSSWEGFAAVTTRMEDDPLVENVYKFDLTPDEQYIFEHSTGYKGAEIMTAASIARKMGILPSQLSQKKRGVAQKLEQRRDVASLFRMKF